MTPVVHEVVDSKPTRVAIVALLIGALLLGVTLNVRDGSWQTLEWALVHLGELTPERLAPHRCFWCKFSDYEAGTGFGDGSHLGCFVRDAEAYERIATDPDMRVRRGRPWALRFAIVDDFHSCPEWQRRPPGFGYRG